MVEVSAMNKLLINLAIIALLISSTACSFVAANSSGEIEEDYGKRTLGTQVEDNTIEAKASASIKKLQEKIGDSNINVYSFNKVLLITGQVRTENAKNIISQATQKIRHVKRVHNELEVIGPSSFLSRVNDSYLSSKVSSRLIFTDGVDSRRIETVVENGTVYLIGLVTQEEAKRSVEAMQQVSGLEKIVRVFEYIDNQTR